MYSVAPLTKVLLHDWIVTEILVLALNTSVILFLLEH